MNNLFISFSGGETSAFMTYKLLTEYRHMFNDIKVIFANTGQEHPKTLEFIKNCDDHFGFNTIWLEAVQNHGVRKSASARVVDFETADRKGIVFEDMIKKYGIPNQEFPHCTRDLKLAPMYSFLKFIGWKKENFQTAIGIRADEFDRISSKAKENKIIYPLISMFPTKKSEVNSWWEKQSFRLDIKSYEGNCLWCWKKTLRKHLTLISENPNILDFPNKMEKKYGLIGAEFKSGKKDKSNPRKFFRKKMSAEDLMNEYDRLKGSFIPFHDEKMIFDESLDVGGGCGETCEVLSDETLENLE